MPPPAIRENVLPAGVLPRGLSRVEAAAYVGVSPGAVRPGRQRRQATEAFPALRLCSMGRAQA